MIFNSFQFIWLFPLIFIIYWLCHKFNRYYPALPRYALLLISYGLYIQWSVIFAFILFFVTLSTFLGAILITKYKSYRKFIIWSSVILTLLPLLLFKYYNFILGAGASVLQWIGIDVAPSSMSWVVPLGLSFYTFQALGYLWDVYRMKISEERNLGTYMLFVSFFPQILCGPISRASDLLPQLRMPSRFNYAQGVIGLRYILWGMFIKIVLADRLGIYVDQIYLNYQAFSGSSSALAAVFYSLQIYGDFAGYSYIAVGVARLMGINLLVNFHRPYFAQSVSQFWKRWNISLTKWLTLYIYIPLGGSRKGKFRTYLNILITFLVSGIWHGANWTFIFWGILHGFAQMVEKFCGFANVNSRGLIKWGRIGITFIFVTIAWVYFRMPDINSGNEVIAHAFSGGIPFMDSIGYCIISIIIVFTCEYIIEFKHGLYQYLLKNLYIRYFIYVFLSLSILLLGVLDSSQFIYVQF